MTPDLETRRRALVIIYNRYLRAERAWNRAQQESRTWLPGRTRSTITQIGNPGSRIRRVHDELHKAMAQLALAHRRLDELKRRSSVRVRVLALPCP